MARIEIEGIGISYELVGDAGAPTVVITPGGRFARDAPGLGEMADALVAANKRVLLWDRPNCGASDICFAGESESKMQALALTGLLRALDLGPATLAGGSAGARVSMLAALHDPDAVSRLALWWLSGGIVSLMTLGSAYCCAAALTASMGGMEAVAAMPAWAEQIERNPRNRDIILSQNPTEFIARMERWAQGFIPSPGSPLPGMTAQAFARLTMPVMIFSGSPTDLYHPAYICEEVHERIPHSVLTQAPWPDHIFARRMMDGTGHFRDWPLLVPAITRFTGDDR